MKNNRGNLDYYENLGIGTKSSAFAKYKEAGLLEDVDEDYVQDVKDFWLKHYNKSDMNPILHIVCSNLNQIKDPRIIPASVAWNEIIPFFNDQKSREIYKDKNLYDKLIPSKRAVESILRCVHGLYFDKNNNLLEKEEVIPKAISFGEDLIVKPSRSNNGLGIKKLRFERDILMLDDEKVTLEMLKKKYGNDFVVQKIIKQHPLMAEPHPSSVNTLRMVTLRWQNEIKYLLTFARFGAGDKVQDNAGAGGVCVGVTDSGEFLDKAINEKGVSFSKHPTTGFIFGEIKPIPNFEHFKDYVKKLHQEVLHHDFISWDIAVGVDGLPIFLEANFSGATWLYQMASQQPLFGDLTEEVLEHVSKNRNNKNSDRWKGLNSAKLNPSVNKFKRRTRILRNKNIKLINKNKQLIKEMKNIKELEREKAELLKKNKELIKANKDVKDKLKDMKNSRSWKLTKVFRKINFKIKK